LPSMVVAENFNVSAGVADAAAVCDGGADAMPVVAVGTG
jgi:hypothetical protein